MIDLIGKFCFLDFFKKRKHRKWKNPVNPLICFLAFFKKRKHRKWKNPVNPLIR